MTAAGARVCVVGAGLAGSLLAWRLAAARMTVHVALGPATADATAASGGMVRGFEPDPLIGETAVSSLVELRASPVLRRWADYREVGSVYLGEPALANPARLAALEAALPGSVGVLDRPRLVADGWSGLPSGCVGIGERHAGYLSPAALRRAVLAELADHPRVRLLPVAVRTLRPRPDGLVRCGIGPDRDYDLVVVAAGGWTGRLLRGSGLPAGRLRTRSVQYAVYEAAGQRPPPFVDDTSGLYGRPVGVDRMLLGLPVPAWDVDPDRPPAALGAHADALRWVAVRLPRLRLGRAVRHAVAADCYAEPGALALRPVAGTAGRISTFTGGSGGSAKTALAASRHAAAGLAAESHHLHRPEGTPL